MQEDTTALNKDFKNPSSELEIRYLGDIRYSIMGNLDSEIALFFIHGAPGSMSMFNKITQDKELQQECFIVSVDRLGYGGSQKGIAEPSIKTQASSLAEIMKLYPDKKWILYGHSFGAPIAAYLAYLMPKQTVGVALAGGAVDPSYEKFEWLARATRSIPIRWIVPKDLRVASIEKINHIAELKSMDFVWEKLTVPIAIQHGTADWLVPFENTHFLQKKLKNAPVKLFKMEGESHFFFSKIKLVKPVIRYLLDKASTEKS